MDKFFESLKKSLVAMLFVIVGFAMTYVPQVPSSHVQPAHAGAGLANVSTEITQLGNNVLLGAGNAINTITAGAVSSTWIKENVLDGLGWAIAKRIVSGMVRSLINWVNSGFQGSPSFIADLKGFLLNIADEEIGRVISELGDVGSFICSPFRLDVQISIATQYARSREGNNAPTCTLTGVIDNIEGFIAGIDPGNGLSDWLKITSTPQTYTPYGATLSAEASARARLINAEGQTLTEVNWGDGFLSQKLCQTVGGTGDGTDCTITKPGKVIQEALSFNLDTGRQSLVAADEINELVGALLNQLANKALTGVAGLLGLSGGTGYTYSDYDGSYLDELVEEAGGQVTDAGGGAKNTLISALDDEIAYRDLAISYRQTYAAFANNVTNPAEDRARALTEVSNINSELEEVNENIIELIDLLFEYDEAATDRQVEILIAYTSLNLTSDSAASIDENEWLELSAELEAEETEVSPIASLTDLIIALDLEMEIDPTDSNWIAISEETGIPIQ
jgi:hypothetical protein